MLLFIVLLSLIHGILLNSLRYLFDSDDLIFFRITIKKKDSDPNFFFAQMRISDTETIYQPIIDINSNSVWIRDNYTLPISSPIISKQCSSIGQTINKHISIESTFDSNRLPVTFVNSGQDNCAYESSIGFSMYYSNSASPILAYNKRMLINDYFSISYNKKSGKGDLILGDQPDEVYDYKTVGITCQSNTQLPKWNCILEGVLVGNISSVNHNNHDDIYFIHYNSPYYYSVSSTPVYFETIHRFIIVPIAFMHYLRDTTFKQYIQSSQCSFTQANKTFMFICRDEVISMLPSFQFNIKSELLSFEPRDLFENTDKDMSRFMIVSEEGRDEWAIGNVFYNKYRMIFDFFNNYISILRKRGNRHLIKIIKNNIDFSFKANKIENALQIIMVLYVLGCILIIISLLKNKLAL